MLALLLALALQQADSPLTLDYSIDAAAEQEQGAQDADQGAEDQDSDAAADAEQAADADAPPPPAPEDVKAVADALELGFRTCVQQVTNRAHVSRTRADALKDEGLDLDGTAPDEVVEFAKSQFPDDRLIAGVKSGAGNVWLVASPTRPVCVVTVSDTAAGPAAREEVSTRMSGNKDWSSDSARSHVTQDVERKAWTQAAGERNTRLLMQLDGPEAPVNGGQGIQAIMTIALIDTKAS